MSASDEILARALQLSKLDRATLAHRLLLTLESDDLDPDSEEAWAAEIDKRLAKIEEGDFSASDWRDAVERIRQSLTEEASS